MASKPSALTARARAAKAPTDTPVADTAAKPGRASREDLIRVMAYTYFERRGHAYGHALEDWLRAEAEVDAQLAAEAARH